MARANGHGVPEWRLQYDIDFESVVRGHHIYKTVWKPEIGERLVCKKDDRKGARSKLFFGGDGRVGGLRKCHPPYHPLDFQSKI